MAARSCGDCRHYFPLSERPDRGTCRVGAPKMSKNIGLRACGLVDLERWPWVGEAECCAKFDWRCHAPGCREPVMKPSPHNLRTGVFFCIQHCGQIGAYAA